MPGARLTHEDRRLIAAWLAEGLGYAEIARRLGRPTSTISREVARNGLHGGYLADRAQQAAGRRARRRGPTGEPQGEPPIDGRPSEEVRAFVDELAVLLAGTGLTRMASRVFACLITSDAGSLTAAELVRRLQVSPASVSKAIAALEAIELLRREPDSRGRRERYVVGDDVWRRAWRADTGAHAEVARAARRGVDVFGAGTPAAIRLGRMGRFFAQISEQMDGGGLTEAVVLDTLTVLAALVHAGRPVTGEELAAALDWPRGRVAAAVDAAGRRPIIADPLALERTEAGAYTVTARPDRLSPAQREALPGPACRCS
ncbi:GbsR/MarR family transcriptional regulator [Nonomuraea rhodomycinica]|uniref:Helix-turn-helix domain-containing protein n=1 Tax=Nonomuraea rhodomycinica TaxID=1712872 RepID=A0A7Y6IIE9_9ACTN|nr:MarR family transcriptional regulator [Nonomuraea rhodomycinica]NUW38712.1 helix-turn-helix domain-containing protein [Nonomuraea rhodomycinica]